ncbi:ABC transporter substrate-binding protein [Leisingera daeponensis]|uniref:ABC transporter substrate-binding protein n=1 Tax=Leisingera daeponensis TaxID=405746 RepID=UPI001C945CE3|nr:ABC transporter substrate-binding protein [Leisingera daeponensis]MBY6059280.1 ABC transporter substrate-binding protein [Leisingera daeponensis]
MQTSAQGVTPTTGLDRAGLPHTLLGLERGWIVGGTTTLSLDAEGGIEDVLYGGLVDTAGLPMEDWCDLGHALLRTDVDHLAFHWLDETRSWHHVRLTVDRTKRRPSVAMQVAAVESPFDLSPREMEVVTLIAAGFGNENIAVHLDISRRTVDKHIQNIFQKTETWTRSGVAGLAIERGLLVMPLAGEVGGPVFVLGKVNMVARSARKDRPAIRRIDRNPISIGMPLPLNSAGRDDALEMLQGAQLAVARLNRQGGVLDREVKIETVDCDITNPDAMKQAIEKLAAKDVAAITAGYSYADPSVFEKASDYRAPFLHAATMDHVVRWVRENPGRYSNIFQTCASDINYGRGLARFLSWLITTAQWAPSNRRIAVIQPPWPGLDIGLSDLDIELVGRNWDIVHVPAPDPLSPDWGVVMAKLEKMEPSVILLATYMVEDSIAFQQAFSAHPLPALVYKLYSPSIPVYRSTLGKSAEGVVWATTTGLYSDTIGKTFQTSFEASHGRRPGRSHAGIAFDRINLLAGAWSRVGNARRFDDVASDLRSSIYRGVNGAYYFGNAGQVGLTFPDDTADPSISQAHLVFQIQNGRQRIISPTPYADGAFRLPPWIPRATRRI